VVPYREQRPGLAGGNPMSNTILLIQNQVSAARAVQQALLGSGDASIRIEWVRSCSKGLERLECNGQQSERVAAIFVDLSLPDSKGIDTFDRLFRAAPHIPILVLSALRDEETAKLAVQHGAQDYLVKSRLDSYVVTKALGNMIERAANAEALFEEKERAQVTLDSIGDAVISTDANGRVTYINAVAEALTGWSRQAATARPLAEVFRIVDVDSREVAQDPLGLAIRENRAVSLTPNCVLVRRDGGETHIEDSAAPIHDRRGTVTGAVIVFRDVTAARALSLKMSHLAQHDSLTDLPNRILLNDRLGQAMPMALRHGKKLAVLYADIDRFKHVNDSAGHTAGDRLLQSVANRLLDCVRSSDTVSRQGGDEFVILLCDLAGPKDAAVAAGKMLVELGRPHRIDQLELHVSASIGIAVYPEDGATADALLKNADAAMYRAKDCGRNNYQFFKNEMNRYALEHRGLENDLHHALERQEFVLHYQPKVNLLTGAITGVEALLRWRHPKHRLIRPSRFISIAENSGLIVPIGKWVLQEACRQAKAWQVSGSAPASIAINVSPVELRAKGFLAGVRRVLSETGLAASHLELEITETFLMQDTLRTVMVLDELKKMGVQLALDDFGTGYSSLSFLKRFPIDTLKIDHSFVRDLATDKDDASIVSAVVDMGRSLNMRVVAEGVETLEQYAFLKRHHCPEAQGFYFSRPMLPSAVARLFAAPVPVSQRA
jgi:diguanylate cyclase (GGDEF)-like protein/PAS domain S-box-containing protein